MGQFGQELLNLLGMVLFTMAMYLVIQLTLKVSQYATAKLEEKKKQAEAAGKTAKVAAFSFAINTLNCVTNTVVSRIEAEKAYTIRQAVKAGEAKVEELNILSTEAYEEIVELLGSEVKDILDECVNNTELFIREKIEELLPKVKADYQKTLSGEVAANAEQAEG